MLTFFPLQITPSVTSPVLMPFSPIVPAYLETFLAALAVQEIFC